MEGSGLWVASLFEGFSNIRLCFFFVGGGWGVGTAPEEGIVEYTFFGEGKAYLHLGKCPDKYAGVRDND